MESPTKAPVFVVGCGRSGTTLLYHMLLSSGGFAVYRTETHVFDQILPRFGNLRSIKTRTKLMERWIHSHDFERSGLDAGEITRRVLAECTNGGDFIRIVMESIAAKQKVHRWAECTPGHLLFMRQIKRTVLNAKFIHIIRDGRDVALSLDRVGWVRPFPWDKRRSLLVAGIHWDWMVRCGIQTGSNLGTDYAEVHFEDLITTPRETLARLGRFIDHDLNYDRIQQVGIGSVSDPNTAFARNASASFNPIDRWRTLFSRNALAVFEGLLGDSLSDLGYSLGTPHEALQRHYYERAMRLLYCSYFSLKHWIKTKPSLSGWLVRAEVQTP